MSCRICSITNGKVRQAIEDALVQFDGAFPNSVKAKLCEEYPEFVQTLSSIDAHDCEMHFNFHQAAGRSAQSCSIALPEESQQGTSIASDVGKDEAEILLDLLNTQYATFTALTNKINNTIVRATPGELTGLLVNPGTAQFYKELGDSVRATVRELRELNAAINGKQDGSLEGLKALALALGGNQSVAEQTTAAFDD